MKREKIKEVVSFLRRGCQWKSVYEKLLLMCVMLHIFLGVSAFAYAEGNVHVGALEIHPFINLVQKYDDNIFLEADNQENDDWITTWTLGFNTKMPLIPSREDSFILETTYAADIIKFWDNDEQDRTDHTLHAAVDCEFANDWTFRVEDDFKKTADPPNSELTSLVKRIRNTGNIVVGYIRDKIGFDVGYKNIRDDYDNSTYSSLDKYEHVITATGYYQLFPKTSVFGEYNYGRFDYDEGGTNSDSTYNQFRVGLKGEIAPKLTGTVKAGYKTTSYEQSSKDDFKGGTIWSNLTYEIQERTTMNIYGERGAQESSYSTNSYYAANRAGIRLDHQLLDRLFLITGGSYQLNKYPDETTEGSVTAKRKDDIWSADIGLRYEIREWSAVELMYERKERDSKFNTFDYEDNKISTRVSVLF